MIISRTPFRISFFGGGTDYPDFYQKHGGSVLATAIDKYCHLSCRYLPPFFEHKYRIVWSQIELAKKLSDIKHPVIPKAASWLNINEGLEIHHQGDLPARSGMGSSSAFAVGLLNALHALKGEMLSSEELLNQSLFLEQHLLQEHVGSQDQAAATYGGFNRFKFHEDGDISACPVTLSPHRKKELNDNLMLFFSGISRQSSQIASSIISNIPDREEVLLEMKSLVDEATILLCSKSDIKEFGRMLDYSWQLKKSLSNKICNDYCDQIYQAACNAGAIGGKVLGAGGGGFMLFFVPPEKHQEVQKKLVNLVHVPFKFTNKGSQIIHHDSENHHVMHNNIISGNINNERVAVY